MMESRTSNDSIDHLVANMLLQKERVKVMKEAIATEQNKLSTIETSLKQKLASIPSSSYQLELTGGDGEDISNISLGTCRRREYLSKTTIKSLLHNFFQTKFGTQQTEEAIQEISSQASDFVWSNRNIITETDLKVKRKKRRRSAEQ